MNDKDTREADRQNAEQLRPVLKFFYLLGGLGMLVIIIYGLWKSSFATCVIWALACLISGAAVGFLFGIPKILQGSKTAGTDKATPDYQLQVNTNLTEISDWLTKIIVGLGLVKLTKIPPYINSLAVAMADGIVDSDRGVAMAFAYGTICFFSILGFLFGYLLTRLYLSKALSVADQQSLQIQDLKGQLEIQLNSIDTKQSLLTHTLSQEGKGPEEAVNRAVQPLTADQKINALVEMANDYLNVKIADWAERTRVKDAKANAMGTYALSQGVSAKMIFDAVQGNANEGLVLAMATLINADPHQGDLTLLLQAGQGLQLKHVRYRVLLAIVALQRKGYINVGDKDQVVNLVRSYKANADSSLLQQIDYTLSFLNA